MIMTRLNTHFVQLCTLASERSQCFSNGELVSVQSIDVAASAREYKLGPSMDFSVRRAIFFVFFRSHGGAVKPALFLPNIQYNSYSKPRIYRNARNRHFHRINPKSDISDDISMNFDEPYQKNTVKRAIHVGRSVLFTISCQIPVY